MADTSKNDVKEAVIEVIEPFAETVQKDLAEVHRKFDGVREEFGSVHKSFERVHRELEEAARERQEVHADVRDMKENASELFTKLDTFISLYEAQRQELVILNAHVKELEERIAKLEANQGP